MIQQKTGFTGYPNRNTVVILILGCVNSLFILKYSVRLGAALGLVAFLYLTYINAQSLSMMLALVLLVELAAINDGIAITYFIFCIPVLLLSLQSPQAQ